MLEEIVHRMWAPVAAAGSVLAASGFVLRLCWYRLVRREDPRVWERLSRPSLFRALPSQELRAINRYLWFSSLDDLGRPARSVGKILRVIELACVVVLGSLALALIVVNLTR